MVNARRALDYRAHRSCLKAFAYQGITYTSTENILDIGPLQASVDKQETIPLPPIILNPAVA